MNGRKKRRNMTTTSKYETKTRPKARAARTSATDKGTESGGNGGAGLK
jgi:hypothetical protein